MASSSKGVATAASASLSAVASGSRSSLRRRLPQKPCHRAIFTGRSDAPPLPRIPPRTHYHTTISDRKSLSTSRSRHQQQGREQRADEEIGSEGESQRAGSTSDGTVGKSWLDDLLQAELSEEPQRNASSRLGTRRPDSEDTVTLEELQAHRPDPSRIRLKRDLPRNIKISATEQRLWKLAFNSVNKGYTIAQLVSLARQARLPIGGSGKPTMKKRELVELLIRSQFGLNNPNEKFKSEEETARYSKAIPVTQTTLYLMLADGGKFFSEIASKFDVDLQPDLRMKPTNDGSEPTQPEFFIVATGDKLLVDRDVEIAIEDFADRIRSEIYQLDVPRDAIDADLVQQIAQQTMCSINLHTAQESRGRQDQQQQRPRLLLSASDNYSIEQAKAMLSAMQGRLLQPDSTLLAHAAPSPLDEAYTETSEDNLTLYGFLPAVPNASLFWAPKATGGLAGDRSSGSFFRLARIRTAAWSQSSVDKSGKTALVDIAEQGEQLGTSRNWRRLDERLDSTGMTFNERLGAASEDSQKATVTRSLQIGQLLFIGRSYADELPEAEGHVLQQVFGAPLSGAWPLDTAYSWFKGSDAEEASKSVIWMPTHLHGTAHDGLEQHFGPVKVYLEGTEAKEHDKIRLVYWATPDVGPGDKSRSVAKDEVVRLEIDVREEVEDVAPPPASEDSGEGDEDTPDAMDLLGSNTSQESSEKARKFSYVIESARWVTKKQADVFRPDNFKDLRAVTEKSLVLQQDGLGKKLELIQQYLAELTRSVANSSGQKPCETYYDMRRQVRDDGDEMRFRAPRLSPRWSSEQVALSKSGKSYRQQHDVGNDVEEGAQTRQTHPKIARRPVPLPSPSTPSPPLSFHIDGMTCRFESAERVYTSAWEIDTAALRERQRELRERQRELRERKRERLGLQSDVGDQDDVVAAVEAFEGAGAKAWVVNETTQGGETGDASRTCTRIMWVEDDAATATEPASRVSWKQRIEGVSGLLTPMSALVTRRPQHDPSRSSLFGDLSTHREDRPRSW